MKLRYFKCSEFYCLNIFFVPKEGRIIRGKKKDKNFMDNPKNVRKVHDMASLYWDFRWKFLELVLGKDQDWLQRNYPVYTTECMNEFLDNFHGIKVLSHGGYYQFLIPVQFQNLIEWCKQNKPVHSKEPTKYPITYLAGRESRFQWVPDARKWMTTSKYYKDYHGVEDLVKIEFEKNIFNKT